MRNIGIEYAARGEMRFYILDSPPELKPSEILIRTHYSGITNGTERHALLAEHVWSEFPSRHGYQHIGRVEAVGDKVERFREGDFIYFGKYVGHRGWHVEDVAWADVHSYDSHLCIPLPEGLDRKYCALLGVAGVAMRGVRRCRVGAGQNVWVAGAGLIGQFAAQAARAVGARVTVSDVNEKRLHIAQELGADSILNARNTDYAKSLKDQGPYDCIIDACGVESLFLDIHEAGLLAHCGVIGGLAVRTRSVFHWSMLHGLEASIEVSCHYSLDDLRVLLQFIQRGIIRIEPLVSHIVSIDEAPRIYEILRDKPAELLGVILDWTA
ncbi:MAG: zinc-binding dehydrogenase [bacterium]